MNTHRDTFRLIKRGFDINYPLQANHESTETMQWPLGRPIDRPMSLGGAAGRACVKTHA